VPKHNVGDPVKGASADLPPDPSLVRGRGRAGMIGDDPAAAVPAPGAPQHPQGDMVTSKQTGSAEPKRPVKSFRLRADLAHRIEILAAQQRRKLYELVEEALEDYLARHQQA